MASDLESLDLLLKDVYLPGLPSYVNTVRPIWGRLQKITDKKRFKGRKFTFAAKLANPQGTGAIDEGEDVPVAGSTSLLNMTLAMKYHYAVAKLSAQVMDAASSDVGAFADAVQTELNGARDQLIEDMAIAAVYGDGSGSLGTVLSYATTVLTMKSQVQPTIGMFGSRALRKGMRLSSYTAKSGGSQGADYSQIAAIPSPTTATMPTSAGFVANDYVFRATKAGSDPRNKVMMGIGGIVDDGTRVGTIQGASRTTYPELKANVLGASGVLRSWTPELMDTLAVESWNNGGGGYPSAFYSPLEIQQRAASYLREDRTYDMSVKTLDGGYQAVKWTYPGGTGDWFVDRFAIPNEIQAIVEKDLFMAIEADVQPEKRDGSMWRIVDRTHAFECWLYTWRNLGCRQFNNHTVLRDISHTV